MAILTIGEILIYSRRRKAVSQKGKKKERRGRGKAKK